MRFLVLLMTLSLVQPVMAKDINDYRTYGKEAPKKMYLFTSLACPHCAQFHREILPEIQKEYLDTGKGQVVIVDMLMNRANLMGAMLLRCAPAEKTDKIETNLYDNQRQWAYDEDQARTYLSKVALNNGISAGEFETCMNNKELAKTVSIEQERMAKLYGVSRMPTVLVRENEKTCSWEGADKELVLSGLSDFFK